MAVQQRIFQTTNDLGTLRELVDLIKDPKKLIAAHDEARKQTALTEDEARKAAEARDFIVKSKQISDDLEAQRKKVEKDKAAHEEKLTADNEASARESERLAVMADSLNGKAKEHAATDARQKSERKDLEDYKNRLDADYKNKLIELNKKATADDKLRLANETEASSLATLRKILEAKAAKFKEAAAI